MRLVIATDNRFWRSQMGSQKRIASLYRHLVASGYEVIVFFVGVMSAIDGQPLSAFRPAIALRHDRPQPPERAHLGPDGCRPAPSIPTLLQRSKAAAKRVAKVARAIGREARDVLRGRHPASSFVHNAALRSHEPTLSDFDSPRTAAAFERLLRDFRPDGVIVEYVRLQYLAPVARRVAPGARLIVDTHDVLHERCEHFHQVGELHEVDISADEEAKALDRFALVLAIQQQDARKLAELTSARVIVAGYPHELVPEPIRFVDDARIVFGGADMAPNVAAASELLADVWPRLNALQGRTVPLHFFGGVCERLPPIRRDGLHVHGFVDDVGLLLRPGDILVNLVRFGGGLKIKNVEALCHGMALITTGVGAEGLEDGAGSAFLVVDSAVDAAAAADLLLRKSEHRCRLAAAAIAYAKAHFASKAVYRDLEDALSSHEPQHRSDHW